MNKVFVYFLFFITGLNFSNCFAQQYSNLNSIENSCFKVFLYKKSELVKTGSGFVLLGNNEIGDVMGITNEHVLDGGDSAVIEFQNEKISIDSVQYVSFSKDFVVFEMNTIYKRNGLLSSIEKSRSEKNEHSIEPIIGEKVFTISSPEGLLNSISSGIISSLRSLDKINYIQFTAPVSPGSSGGALINDQGNLIGLISSQYTDGQNLNFALGINEIINDFLNQDGDSLDNFAYPIDRLNEAKVASSPFLKEIDSLAKVNMPLAYQKMQAKPQLINNDEKLLFDKLNFELKSNLYLDFISTCSTYYYKNGLNSLLGISLIVFRNQIDSANLSYINYTEIIAQINRSFPKFPDIIPFSDIILGTCKYKIEDYYSAITYMNEFENFKNENLKFDDVDHKTNYTLLSFYFYYGYEIIGFSYFKLDNYSLAIQNLSKCLDLSVSDEGCSPSFYLISAFVKQNDFENACRYFKKYRNICSPLYGDDFKRMFNDYCR